MKSSRKVKTWKNAPYCFYIEECGANGDCLFHVLAKGLQRTFSIGIRMQMMRVILANSVDDSNIRDFVKIIASDHAKHLLQGSLDFSPLYTWLQEHKDGDVGEMTTCVKKIIRNCGTKFQGTDDILNWLVNRCDFFISRKIGFIVFSAFGPDFITKIDTAETHNYLLLYNNPNAHWQLANLVTHNGEGYCSVTPKVLDSLLKVSHGAK
jgi:hypothetical protein